MRLSIQGAAIATGLLWGGCLLFVGLINLAMPSYGVSFLRGMSSVYPFFHASRTFGDLLLGAFDGLIDGAIAGVLFVWLYNMCRGKHREA